MATFTEYLQQPEAQRILLVEIQRTDVDSTRYYLSDDFYVTEPVDTPANLDYSPTIGGRGLPNLRRQLNDIFSGNASTGFGTLELVSREASFIKTTGRGEETMFMPRGASVSVQIVAPRSLFPRSDFIELLQGKVARTGFTSEGFFSIELVDGSAEIAAKEIEIEQFPMAFGYCFNVTPFPVNTRVYAVHDGPIEAVVAVYDNGVALSPSQYTVNLTTGQFTLAENPIGIVTADVKGDKTGGTYAATTQQVLQRMIDRFAPGLTATYGLPTGEIGYYIQTTQSLGITLNELTQACAGYWLVDRLGVLRFAQYPIPVGLPAAVFTEQETIGEVNGEDADELFDRVRYTFRQNYTPGQVTAPGALPEQADFARRNSFEGQVVLGGLNPEYEYNPSPILTTYFANNGDAQAVAVRVLDLHSVPRSRISLSVPFTEALDIGTLIEITFFGQTYVAAVTGVTDVFDGSYPIQKLEVIA